MPDYILSFLIAVAVALAITPLVMLLAKKTGAIDAPDPRKVHKKPIPRIGGIGIYIAFMVSFLTLVDFNQLPMETADGIIGLLVLSLIHI